MSDQSWGSFSQAKIPTEGHDMAVLTPCPFCGVNDRSITGATGHSPAVVHRSNRPEGFVPYWTVECDGCGSEGPAEDDADRAIAAWNRRAQPASQVAEMREKVAMDWLVQNRNAEVSYSYCEDHEGWSVHTVSGGINDREWTLLAVGETPTDAILAILNTSREGGA